MDRPIQSREAQDATQANARMPPGAGKPPANDEQMRYTRQMFEQLGKVKAPGRSLFERFFDRLLPALPDSQKLDWGDEADWARLQQEPIRARRLLRIIVVVVILLLIWAAMAPLDEVTRGEGQVKTSLNMQKVQAVDPGVVEKILVREGQEVEEKQLLLRIDASRYDAELGAADADRLNLTVRVARLQALADDREFVVPDEVLKLKPDLAEQEKDLYLHSRNEVDAQLAIARMQLTQREQDLREVEALHVQSANGLKLAKEELGKNEPLLESGAVSEVEIIRLKQAVEKFDGDRKQALEKIGRARAAIIEAQNKIQETKFTKYNQWRKDLSEASAKLASVIAGTGVSLDKVKHTEVRAPVRGTINRLLVSTVGGVVKPGDDLVEIVPLGDQLLIEANIKPKDIAFLHPGQQAQVKITAYDFSIYGGLDGTLEQISPNTVKDEKGNPFYVIKVKTKKSSLGANKPITPGMGAEVNVLTGKKTVLSYLLKPVLKAKANAMTEK